jgi:hypothetical protein
MPDPLRGCAGLKRFLCKDKEYNTFENKVIGERLWGFYFHLPFFLFQSEIQRNRSECNPFF